MINKFGNDLQHLNATHSQLFEHCVCPDGFFGIQCEHKIEICSGGEHVCLHGSKCVADNESGNNANGQGHTCDCDEGFDSVERYAGKFCQYTSTDICTRNGQPGVGKANFAFCVNNGVCKAKVEDNQEHPGCTCGAGFTGEHCEYLVSTGGAPTASPGSSSDASASEPDSSGGNGAVVGISLALIVIIGIDGFFVLRTLLCSGRSRGGKSGAAEVEAAVAAEEYASQAPDAGPKSGSAGTAAFEGGDESLDDLEDFTNDSLTEDGAMTNVQIV